MVELWLSAPSSSQSIQEVDVLLDVLRVAKTPYLKPEQIAQHQDDRMVDHSAKLKQFHWASRRKVSPLTLVSHP